MNVVSSQDVTRNGDKAMLLVMLKGKVKRGVVDDRECFRLEVAEKLTVMVGRVGMIDGQRSV